MILGGQDLLLIEDKIVIMSILAGRDAELELDLEELQCFFRILKAIRSNFLSHFFVTPVLW